MRLSRSVSRGSFPFKLALCAGREKFIYAKNLLCTFIACSFSGYDGAIRCLVENGGDVAFTKVIFVRKYFGVSSLFDN